MGADYNAAVIHDVAVSVKSTFEIYREHQCDAVLRHSDGTEFEAQRRVLVLRKIGATAIQSPPRG